MDLKTLSRLSRFKDIVMILMKYGFDDLVKRLNFPGMGVIRKIHHANPEMDTYERIRHALEDLGPTFVKFGQIMSLRPDLLPRPFIQELSRLQDEVASVELEEIREVIESSLEQPLEDIFSIFDSTPLAAASLSQVHRGVLRDEGKIVAVKVQRPGIRKIVEMDLDILAAVAERLHENSRDLMVYDLPNLVRVTRRNLLREMDFTREARNMKIARSLNIDEYGPYIPLCFSSYCTELILVTEFIQGSRLKDIDQNITEAEDLAKQGLRSAIKQILVDGFFHADPHPGNILVTDDMKLCLLDWGMIGRLTEKDRYELIDLIKSIVGKDSASLMNALLEISRGEYIIDRRGMERELLDILDSYYAVPVKDLNIGHMLLDITGLLREYRLRLPPDLVIMVKALITAEGTARRICPDLDVFSEAEEYVKDIAAQRYKTGIMWRNFHSFMSQFLSFQRQLPGQVARFADKIDRGELSIGFEHKNLEGIRSTLENTFSRLTFGIIIAALIIGSSMLITTGIGPLLLGFPALGIIGYLISGVLGLWLVFNIIRSRRF